MTLLVVSFFFYFLGLFLFCLISHTMYYCLLLVLNSLLCCFIGYLYLGFSWYSLLFCLVYVGGVYILFIFVSVYSPNTSIVPYWNLSAISSLLILACCFLGSFVFYSSYINYESSLSLCTSCEGYFYVCMCLMLLFGFFVLSMVMSVKTGYYR
uniref:NADH dehydrogenase subunit 6 n=2 Tax=Diplogonoporus TaxID=433351 RepID=I0FX40_DIPGA|nr:NADH dehydrogenase subunit 6 [Diplogonoporus balaenopterae]YP_006073395.1 NADH dehydrogenase subunit 6 [Diplogonoporus grandis]BAL73065.1 NADH dehydrogenase subunit 6 [Diplogonoporus balaenopterae]BAL73077.1 NADH dehydrogenase subunit 6 [Diplogonoporus grandis]